ncbi:MAG TPA: WbuC family cupin fold metalloprotein [Gammaproteobacteria bacterium]|nr:WbuC family cupin fold metalloprotein [Gammaproteobacteria bacterium]
MKLITADLIDDLVAKAGQSPRRRTNYNVHTSGDAPVQRYFIAAKQDSYFRPHRHPTKWEFALVIRGGFDVLVFDDEGRVTERQAVGPQAGVVAFEIPANTWHTWLPTAEDSAFVEIKEGPYDPASAAEFAAWAPEEGAAEVADFVQRLRTASVGSMLV